MPNTKPEEEVIPPIEELTATIENPDTPVKRKEIALCQRGFTYCVLDSPELTKAAVDFLAAIRIWDKREGLVGHSIDGLYWICSLKGDERAISMLLDELGTCGNAIGKHRPEFFWMLEKLDAIRRAPGDVSDEKLAKCLVAMRDVYEKVSGTEWDTPVPEGEEPEVFHHYTRSEVFRLLVPIPGDESNSAGGEQEQVEKSNFLRLGNMEYVNDPHEGLALQEHCRRCRTCTNRVWERLTDDDGLDNSIASKMFVLCFAGKRNKLDHWRMYGHEGAGISVGIPKEVFKDPPTHHRGGSLPKIDTQASKDPSVDSKKPAEPEGHALWTPMSVMYDEKAKKKACDVLREPLQAALDCGDKLPEGAQKIFTAAITGLLLRVLYRFKDEEYLSEGEWRSFVFEPDLTKAKIDIEPTPNKEDEPLEPHRVYLETERVLFEKPGYEVWIGPKVDDARKVRLEFEYRLACKKQAGNVDLNISKHHYR